MTRDKGNCVTFNIETNTKSFKINTNIFPFTSLPLFQQQQNEKLTTSSNQKQTNQQSNKQNKTSKPNIINNKKTTKTKTKTKTKQKQKQKQKQTKNKNNKKSAPCSTGDRHISDSNALFPKPGPKNPLKIAPSTLADQQFVDWRH